MTLSKGDMDRVASDIAPFVAQNRLDRDLPNVIKNMLREFSNHPDVPDAIELNQGVIRDICDQREIGPVSLNIDSRLSVEFSDLPFEANYEADLELDDLREMVENPNYSYPITELSLNRYDPPCYDIQTDKNGRTRKLRVLVMAINDESILLYDPLRYDESESGDEIEATQIDQPMFKQAWKGRLETTSTLWVESTEQKRLAEYDL